MVESNTKWQVYRLRIEADRGGKRLDHFLPDVIPDLSRSLVRKIIDIGGVHVNGQRKRTCSQPLVPGDQVELYIDQMALEPYRIRSQDVVFQDRYLIVLNKPAMIETQPTHARYKGTLYEALQHYLKDPYRPRQKPTLGMIQRLDRTTSGLILFSIHPDAHKKMTRMFLDGSVEKKYLALVSGQPDPASGEIRSLLARSRRENRVHSVAAGGKLAITRYTLVAALQDYALLEVQILTGRSHQIRAHMAELECPLIGDSRYGGPKSVAGLECSRAMLHSRQLKFYHPVTGQPLDFSVPMPEDMKEAVDFLGRR
ncbi:MAG: RluA family pseudouridine synthase [Pelovirga sp.]